MSEEVLTMLAEKFARMTEADWKQLRERVWKEIANDPEIQRHRHLVEASELTGPCNYSGNITRLPMLR